MPAAPRIEITIKLDDALAELHTPITDRAMMAALGATQTALIKFRTVQKHRNLRGGALKAYSKKALYISKTGKTAKRKAPGGGKTTADGKSVFYAGGYRQYKKDSTGSDKVNYTLSGATMAKMLPTQITKNTVKIGFSGAEAQRIASGLQNRDEFFGVSAKDIRVLTDEAVRHVKRLLKGQNAAVMGRARILR